MSKYWINIRYLTKYLILPTATPFSNPSWFGFPITLRENIKFKREELLYYLEENNIGTRLLFAGNVVKQPYMINQKYRIVGRLKVSDLIMKNSFWIGLYPGLKKDNLHYVSDKIHKFIKSYS